MKDAMRIDTEKNLRDYLSSGEWKELLNIVSDRHQKIRIWYDDTFTECSFISMPTVLSGVMDKYPVSFYKENREDHSDYGKWVLLLRDHSYPYIRHITELAYERWDDIINYILRDNESGLSDFGHRVTWTSKDDEDSGLSTYTVYVDGIVVGNFKD